MAKFIGIVFVFMAISCSFVDADYCNLISCYGNPHTACRYQSPYPAPSCRNVQSVGLTPDQKARILKWHNRLRTKVARGRELRGAYGPQPPAINMKHLEWDNELEQIAQRWANQCNFSHDSCRDVARFQVGQNIGYRGTTRGFNTMNVKNIVFAWFNEVQYYNGNDVKQFSSSTGLNGNIISHYTQFVWAETNKLGCGAIKYTEGIFNRLYLVCNYGPAGNFIGMPVYRTN